MWRAWWSADETLDGRRVGWRMRDCEGRVWWVCYLQVEFNVQPEQGTPPVQGWVKAIPDWFRTVSRHQRGGSGTVTGRGPSCRAHTFKGVLWDVVVGWVRAGGGNGGLWLETCYRVWCVSYSLYEVVVLDATVFAVQTDYWCSVCCFDNVVAVTKACY